jgi:hypothetical protein
MSMKIGETGVTFRANAGFDMSSNTELEIVFLKPDNTEVVKASADGVTLGTVAVTDDDLGALTANEYVEYETEDIFDTAGTWRAYVRYTNTASTPDDYFIGNTATFEVKDPQALN